MTSNPRSRLVSAFRRAHMDNLADQNELDAAHAVEEDLEAIEALLRIDWHATARDRIEAFEAEYNLDFEEMISDDPHMQRKIEEMEAEL